MNPNQENILKSFDWRYATKKFDATKKVSADDWKVLSESLRQAPSSYGLQPWKFIVVQNTELRKKLTPLSWGQTQVEDCSHYVVFTTLKTMTEAYIGKYVGEIAKVRATPVEGLDGYKNMMIGDLVKGPRAKVISAWAHHQSYIAMGFLMETAGLLQIDACPMEGIDPAGYDKVLGIENSDYHTVAACAVGYRHAEDGYAKAKKVRFAASEIFDYRT